MTTPTLAAFARHLAPALRFLKSASVAVVLGAGILGASGAAAQQYPAGPIKMIIPYAAGGPVDVVGRIVSEALAARLGVAVVVDNRPGAGTSLGTATVAKSAPDGYTLMIGNAASHAMNPALNKVPYDPVSDFAPISLVASMPLVLLTSPSLKVKTLAELVALAKQKGDLSYASAGSGSSTHLITELFKQLANVQILHIPYKARAPAEVDVISGRVSMMFDSTATAVPRVQAGVLTGLAVTSRQRLPAAPNLPTVSEAGYGDFWADMWVGVFAPAGTPAPIVRQLNQELSAIMKQPDIQERFVKLGGVAQTSSPEELSKLVGAELARWTGVIKSAGITPE